MRIAPKTALKFLLVFALGIPTAVFLGRTIARAQDQAGGERQTRPAPDRDETASRSQLDPQVRKRLQQAARSFAEQVAGKDDARFVQVFERAYQLAEESALQAGRETRAAKALSPVPEGLSLEEAIRRREASQASADSIFNDPTYVENYRKLLEQGASPRIVGGVDTDPGEFPDCVAVGSETGWCCTGTLVAPNVVVTAGHCDGGCASRVYFGL
ncbi:MAG: trypsin-like serine protease, partial [Candidatus Saccharimonas sp.]|nr:trypsin-like serine protease [Planctomycetaceae bacterium]